MKFDKFREKSLVMGLLLSSQGMTAWLRKALASHDDVNVLGSLIIAGLYFENRKEPTGPTLLSKSLGVSKSRISQEITHLEALGFLRRSFRSSSARSIALSLTPAGEKKALQIIKIYSDLQRIIDSQITESKAEATNRTLLQLVGAFRT